MGRAGPSHRRRTDTEATHTKGSPAWIMIAQLGKRRRRTLGLVGGKEENSPVATSSTKCCAKSLRKKKNNPDSPESRLQAWDLRVTLNLRPLPQPKCLLRWLPLASGTSNVMIPQLGRSGEVNRKWRGQRILFPRRVFKIIEWLAYNAQIDQSHFFA